MAKKKYGHVWVTIALVEYCCSLGCSDLPVSDNVTGEVISEKAV